MSDTSEKIDSVASKHSSDDKRGKANLVQLAKDGFDHGSANYDKNRPNYTEEAIDYVSKEITIGTPPACSSMKYNVLELGAGTGKLTEGLAPRLSGNIKYLATEPSKDFLGMLKSKMLPVETLMAAANDIPLADNMAENIVCAQSFHWFSDKESLQEIQRVLVPHGKLILIWNSNKYDEGWQSEVLKQRYEVIERVGGSADHSFQAMQWFKDIASSPLFSLSEHRSLSGIEFKCNLDRVIENTRTLSAYNALPETERKDYLDKLRRTLLAWPGVDPDDMDILYTTEIYIYLSQKSV